jgi:phosphoglycerate dehydrogenase-like enzyme
MKLVFFGAGATPYAPGVEALIGPGHELTLLPGTLETAGQRAAFSAAEVLVSAHYNTSLPPLPALKLFQCPAAGVDAIDPALLPPGVPLCRCYGHEVPIGEYVLAAMLRHIVPLNRADAELRQGHWPFGVGRPGAVHGELAGRTLGLLGYGHIGRHIAPLAAALGMRIVVANRSPVPLAPPLAASYTLDALDAFYAEADFIVCSLPLAEETRSLVGPAAFAAMKPTAVLINVGRGPVIDEDALYEALATRRIAGAVIDTWYVYPNPGQTTPVLPGHRPFHTLDNLTLSPHMSGWTDGLITRRCQTIAANIKVIEQGGELVNRVADKPGKTSFS